MAEAIKSEPECTSSDREADLHNIGQLIRASHQKKDLAESVETYLRKKSQRHWGPASELEPSQSYYLAADILRHAYPATTGPIPDASAQTAPKRPI
jgi:hypothetical protein